MVITQGVEHQYDQLPGRGHRGDGAGILTAPGHDPVPDLFHRSARGSVLDGFDRGPADQSGSLLGDPASMHGLVRLIVLGSQAGPRGQLLRPREPVHIADLGHEHRPEDRPTPGMVCTAA